MTPHAPHAAPQAAGAATPAPGAAGAAAEENVWLRAFAPASTTPRHRLVCFPHAGGSAGAYRPFALELATAGVEMHAVQYPGRQDRRHEPFAKSVTELAEQVLPELLGLLDAPDGVPVALFGHSMGALTAYETVRLLHRTGARQPAGLFVSGRRAPATDDRPWPTGPLGDREILAEVRRLQGTDPGVLADEELLRMVLPVLRSDYAAVGSYRYEPGPVPDCPLTVLTGDEDPNVAVPEATAWQELTSGSFALHVFSGGHFYLNDQRQAVCRTIEETLRHGNHSAR